MEVLVHKVTLSTGKVVLIKDLELADEELASQLASQKSGDNTTGYGYALINELCKLLILKINDKEYKGIAKASAYKDLSYAEFGQIRSVISQLMGGKTEAPKLEIMSVNIGS